MKKSICFIIILFTLISCKDKYEFWDISKFNIVEDAIQDNEEVYVIYYSRGPSDDEVEDGFYRHAVVIKASTGDTINVLTFPNPELDNLSAADNKLVYSNHPTIPDVVLNMEEIPAEMREKLKNLKPEETKFAEYTKVARDPEFDFIAVNKYKTVIGELKKN